MFRRTLQMASKSLSARLATCVANFPERALKGFSVCCIRFAASYVHLEYTIVHELQRHGLVAHWIVCHTCAQMLANVLQRLRSRA